MATISLRPKEEGGDSPIAERGHSTVHPLGFILHAFVKPRNGSLALDQVVYGSSLDNRKKKAT